MRVCMYQRESAGIHLILHLALFERKHSCMQYIATFNYMQSTVRASKHTCKYAIFTCNMYIHRKQKG